MYLASHAGGKEQRQNTKEGSKCGHQYRAQAQQCGVFDQIDRFDMRELFAQLVDEADQYDAVENSDGKDGNEADNG